MAEDELARFPGGADAYAAATFPACGLMGGGKVVYLPLLPCVSQAGLVHLQLIESAVPAHEDICAGEDVLR